LIALLLVALGPPVAFAAEAVKDTSYVVDGSRVLRHEVVVAASAADAWSAFASAEGWRTWAVQFARQTPATLGVGTELETSYNPNAVLGAETNIRQRVLAFIPGRMFAFHTTKVPKGFPHGDAFTKVFSVVEFEVVTASRTRVRMSMLGYAPGKAYDELYAFFAHGNAVSLQKLAQRFETGPIDWVKELAPAPAAR
jgi:hypothetical protein